MLRRRCGECTACCTTMAVKPLNKPMGTACPELTTEKPSVAKHLPIVPGCSIYDRRPEACQNYTCVWLVESRSHWQRFRRRLANGGSTLELFTEEERPDKLGVVFDLSQPDSRLFQATGMYLLSVRPITAGALDRREVKDTILRVAGTFPVYLIDGEKRRVATKSDEDARTIMRFVAMQRAGL